MRAERIAQFLPEIYRASNIEGGVLNAVLNAMDCLQGPSEDILDDLDRYFDPIRSPDRFVPMLANWVDLARYLDWGGGREGMGQPYFKPGLERLRLLVALAVKLNAERGTAAMLKQMLAGATGIEGFEIEENPTDNAGALSSFHIRVRAPEAALRYQDLVSRIVENERPAYVTFEIVYVSSGEPHAVISPQEENHA
jgi:phage tail-like protein